MLEGSKDFSGDWDRSWGWETDGTYKGLTVKKKTASLWHGINKTFTAPKDGNYTFSAYIKGSGATTTIQRYSEINEVTQPVKYMSGQFDWFRDSVTVPMKAGQTAFFRYEIKTSNADAILWTAGHKWEPGSTATPYMQSSSEAIQSDYPSYIGTYTGKISDGQSTNPVKYNWKKI